MFFYHACFFHTGHSYDHALLRHLYSFDTETQQPSQGIFRFRVAADGTSVDLVCDIKPGNLASLGLKFWVSSVKIMADC